MEQQGEERGSGSRPREEDGEEEGGAKRQRREGEGEREEQEQEQVEEGEYEEEAYDEAGYDDGGGMAEGEEGWADGDAEDEGGAGAAVSADHEQAAAGDDEEDVELSGKEEDWYDEGEQPQDGAETKGMNALVGGDIDDEDETEDGNWGGGGGSGGGYNWVPPSGPSWICRNCTADDNDESDVICEGGCEQPREHSLCECPATRIAQVVIPAAQKEKEARRFHLRMAIGYDERMCLHRAVGPVSPSPTDAASSGEDAAPDGEAGESRNDETKAQSAAEIGDETEQAEEADSEANSGMDGEGDSDQTAAIENADEAAQPDEGTGSAEASVNEEVADNDEGAEAAERSENAEEPTEGDEAAADEDANEAAAGADSAQGDQKADPSPLPTLPSVSSEALASLPSMSSAGDTAAATEDDPAATEDDPAAATEDDPAAATEDDPAAAAASDAAEESQPYEFDGFTCNHTRKFMISGGIIKKSDDEYHTFTHPERPDRLKCVYEHLKCAGLLDNTTEISGREATGFELSVAHEAEHVSKIGDIEGKRGTIDGDTYYVEESSVAARLAVGVTCDVISSVVKGESDNGIALVRPPGHHAEGDKAMGFCLFNNVACGARVAQQELGVQRVLIVDWDVHHGNGTENIFYDDPSVLMLSIHRNDMGFFPATGHPHRTGRGEGKGYNVNVAWPKGGMGDADYMLAFHRIVLPIAYDFKPDLVLVSAGFDSGLGDPLGGCRITPEGYAHMTSMLLSLAEGKVVIVMEGGYNLRTISRSFAACARVLKGGAPPPLRDATCRPSSAAMYAVCQAQATQAEFWPALRMPGMADAKGGANGGLPIRGFPGSMGQFLLKGGMGGIPGMYESSDDEDFEGPADESGGGDEGPGLAGMLGGADSPALDDSMEQDAAAGTVEDADGDVELDDSLEGGEEVDEPTAVEDEGTMGASEIQEGAEEYYEESGEGHADEAEGGEYVDGDGAGEGEYSQADAGGEYTGETGEDTGDLDEEEVELGGGEVLAE